MKPHVWGVDPGSVNIGVTLLDPAGRPIYVIDATTVGRGKKQRRVVTRWGPEPSGPGTLAQWAAPPGTLARWAAVELRPDADTLPHVIDAINGYPLRADEQAVVELVGGPVSRDLQIASGVLQGILWARTGRRPAEVAASTWRKDVLGIKGNTKARDAERVAVEWARVDPWWPADVSGHASESRFIAKYGQDITFCLRKPTP